MLRRIFGVGVLVLMLGVLLAGPAAAAPQPVGETTDRNGVHYTIYEETKSDGKLYRYYVEDGALGGGARSSMRFSPRTNGMESAAFIAATLLFAASVLAIYRRTNLQTLLHG